MSCVKYDDSSNDSDDLANQNITRVMHAKEHPRHSNAYGQRHERQRQRRERARLDECHRHRRSSMPEGNENLSGSATSALVRTPRDGRGRPTVR
jgi:hypothetical protein